MIHFWDRFKNTRGQVAIFVALIFQVLFLFFAMVVNVGLLVHHKINLQNSVDLAAYYGAMKQAESMNAIAHINYQIRQSWKLLAWRYRIVGSGGTFLDDVPGGISHPYSKDGKILVNAVEEATPSPGTLAPAFCAAYTPFSEVPVSETLCKEGTEATEISLVNIPAATGLIGVSIAIQNLTRVVLQSTFNHCIYVGPFNWLLLARFKVGYVIDHGARKRIINMLANGLSGQGSADPTADFRELDGSLASVGIRHTLTKNLTIQNRDSLGELKIYNSLGDPNCGVSNPSFEKPPKWLNEILIKPSFSTSASDCNGVLNGSTNNKYATYAVNIEDPDPNQPKHWNAVPAIGNEIAALRPFVNYSAPPYQTSLGVEKNPWCMGYVGVKASTQPKVPFMPFGVVTLTARAYAKPFGGRIGPWYQESWAPGIGATESNIGKRVDERTPARFNPGVGALPLAVKDPTRVPNYSRFPGDPKGLTSRAVQGIYTKALFHMSKRWPAHDLTLTSASVPATDDESPAFSYWSDVARDFITGNPAKDILSWDKEQAKAPQQRLLELSAIAPDIFDTTYYSIEPNFYQVYYKKIQAHKAIANVPDMALPSDLGARIGDPKLEIFNIKNQVEVQRSVLDKIDSVPTGQLQYLLRDVDHVLTSWVPNSLLEYDFAPASFGRCGNPDFRPKPDIPVPGDCIAGGRTGFSVKMVSGDYLMRGDLQLGGNAPTGPLNNPPPSDF